MNISRRWLEAFLRRPLDLKDTVRRLTMLGAPVDAVEPLNPGLEQVLVGLVEEVRPHPNADRLQLCLVNAGGAERPRVVCGAANVTAGRAYPFAPVGAELPGGLRIELRKIRGEPSEGMLCSARELGLGDDHEGLLELDPGLVPGSRLLDALPLADDRIVIDVTPNRGDLLCHKGVARELAISLGAVLRLPEIPQVPPDSLETPRRITDHHGVTGGVTTGTDDLEGCPRFLGCVIRGVRVAPSPRWLQARLAAAGVRAINNVVDATNYVMLELNQPMHAYDIAALKGPEVLARRARAGETVVTLDGVSRGLGPEMTVIADAGGPIGVAGVMGAAQVEVSDRTTEVFLECASFEPRRIRRTRRALGLSTEASQRFERGVDRWAAPEAFRRCVELILATAGGSVADGAVDVWPEPTHPPRVTLRASRVIQVLGQALPNERIESYLTAVGCTVLPRPDAGRFAVDTPGWRSDLTQEVDLIEEIARVHGYDSFSTEFRPFRVGRLADPPLEAAIARVREGLVRRGLLETVSLPLGPSEGEGSVMLKNPLSASETCLRQSILAGLGRAVESNWSHQVRDIRLFEIGTVFRLAGPGQRPLEETHVAGVASGAREPPHWSHGSQTEDFDLWDIKSLFEAAAALAVPDATVQVHSTGWVAVLPDGRRVGSALRFDLAAKEWAAPVYGFELVVEPVARTAPRLRQLPAMPAVERDVALVLPEDMPAAEVEQMMRRVGGALLESVHPFDEYRAETLGQGRRSVAFRLVFRALDRTLRDAEVDAIVARVIAAAEGELDARLRSS
jgi:phenylalanyl-tRNA synthetase beta chain